MREVCKDDSQGGLMFKVKTPSKDSKYWIPTEDFKTALHWSLRYPLWVAELSIDPDTSQAIRYDKERVQTSGNYDSTMEIAIRRDELRRKKELLEETVREVAPDIYKFLLLGVTQGRTVYQLIDEGMPCSKDYFVERRQRYYYTISKRI